MNLGLQTRTALVAASSSGIALATAEKFAAEGARVAMCSRSEARLAEAADGILAHTPGAQLLTRVVDVTDASAVSAFVDEIAQRFGPVDICVTNAGGPPPRMFLDTTDAEWDAAFALNLKSVIHLARAVLPGMRRQRWGRIVTLTSVSVRQPVSDLIYSNAIRAGVLGLVKSLSNEFGPDGVTVNNVGPGYTATERLRSLIASGAARANVSEEMLLQQLGEQAALRRVGTADEVADAILFLSSDRASFITGQTLLVDGGLYKGL